MFHIQKFFCKAFRLDKFNNLYLPKQKSTSICHKGKNSKIIMKLHWTIHNHSVPSVARSSGFIGRKGLGVFVLFCFLTLEVCCAEIVLRVLRVIGHILQWDAKMQRHVPATDYQMWSFWSLTFCFAVISSLSGCLSLCCWFLL